MPASNAVFRVLGLEDTLRAEGFVEKRGASFTTEDGRLSRHIDFTACPEVAAPITYQVPRARFDEILLGHAEQAGVEVRQECRVRDATFAADGVRVTVGQDGQTATARAEFVVDASGQSGFLSKRLALRRLDPKLRNVALYAHYEGVERPEGERSGDIRIVSRRDMSWIWLIPLSSSRTSVGLVVPRERHAARAAEPAEEVLDRVLGATPVAERQMRHAKRVTSARYEADFSYASRAYAGDRWLLAGDAGSFLDPVFSTGVLLALESGLEAAAAVHCALASGTVSARAFAAYEQTQRQRYQYFRRFVQGFYEPAFRELFFQPTNRWGLSDAIVPALAGNWRPRSSG